MMVTTASLALRATSGRTALLTVFAVVIGIVCFVRSGLRERWNDRQSEDDGSDKTALRRTSRLVVSANSRGFSIVILDPPLIGKGIIDDNSAGSS